MTLIINSVNRQKLGTGLGERSNGSPEAFCMRHSEDQGIGIITLRKKLTKNLDKLQTLLHSR